MHAPAFTDILLDERDNLYLAHSRGIVVVNAVSRAIMKTVGRKEQGFADGMAMRVSLCSTEFPPCANRWAAIPVSQDHCAKLRSEIRMACAGLLPK